MKKILPILLIFFLTSCGYTSIYKSQKIPNFRISIENINGDKTINRLIQKKLKRYSSGDNLIYLIDVNSNFSRTVLSKNKTGRATNVNLSTTVQFSVKLNDKVKKFSFKEKLNIENSSDIYEQNNYENSIKDNFVSTIIGKLVQELSTLE